MRSKKFRKQCSRQNRRRHSEIHCTKLCLPHVVGACHHGMARPQVADRGTAPIRSVAANKLNKQSRTADEGWSSSLGVGRGAYNPSL